MKEEMPVYEQPNFSSKLLKIDANDAETVSANTEDSLLNTRSNSETTSISKTRLFSCCGVCGTCCSGTVGLILSTIGILFLFWSPFYIVMEQRIDMLPGLPAFDWWKDPPDEVYLRAYIFNVTNAERFLNGTDEKIHVEEIGPIVYLEKLVHRNISFNENGTLSYLAVREAIYIPELNSINLNSTIVIPNYAVLAIASHLHDASYFTKIGFNILLRGVGSPLFMNSTIYNFLWNLTDPILSVAKHLAPHMVPSENIGVLETIYRNFGDMSTVYIGQKNGHEKFFLLDKYAGSEYLIGHGPECTDKVVNSTEGALYPQYITKNMTLRYWRKTLCRIIPLYFEAEKYMEDYDVLAYKFTKPPDAYNRKEDLSLDCHKGDPVLLSGLSDVSKCFNDINMAASFPHYLYGEKKLNQMVVGLKPNRTAHESYTFVEPLTGIPITSVARSQSNMIVKDTKKFTADLQKFDNLVIPMFWLEYEQIGLPYYVKNMMNFTVNLVPKYQYYFIGIILFLGCLLLVISVKRIVKSNKKDYNYEKNTNMQFEVQSFIKANS